MCTYCGDLGAFGRHLRRKHVNRSYTRLSTLAGALWVGRPLLRSKYQGWSCQQSSHRDIKSHCHWPEMGKLKWVIIFTCFLFVLATLRVGPLVSLDRARQFWLLASNSNNKSRCSSNHNNNNNNNNNSNNSNNVNIYIHIYVYICCLVIRIIIT